MAMTQAMKKAIWIQGLFDNLRNDQDLLKINFDSMSVIYLAKSRSITQERSTPRKKKKKKENLKGKGKKNQNPLSLKITSHW